ncbi:MAG: hypothetical protein M1159_02600 [Candidatus Thermoplasmatota archaeon]|jgi:hydrogenase-4 component E|nr:hypothetical protein [Candidatus Thermoplasmatota archaeon]
MTVSEFLDVIAVSLLFTGIWAQIGTYVMSKVHVIIVQSVLLSVYAIYLGIVTSSIDLVILGILTVTLRGFLTAYILHKKLPERGNMFREISTGIPSITILSVILLVISLAIYHEVFYPYTGSNIGGIGFAMIIQGMLLIASRKNKIAQFSGYIEEENAIILLSLGIVPLPLIVEISVLLDVLALVIVSAVLISETLETENLKEMIG